MGATGRTAAWWDAWCREVEGRLAASVRPLGDTVTAGTLSAFALGEARPAVDVDRARSFVTTLARVQTDRVRSIEMTEGENCANLATGAIAVDAGVIAACPFRPAATPAERLDILGGLALHEAAHQEFSSPAICARAHERGLRFFSVFNLLDDEWIEQRLAQVSPGYGDYLRATRRYMFADAYRRAVVADRSLLGSVLLFVRYPRALDSWARSRWGRELGQVRDILTPFPETEEEVFHAAEQLFQCVTEADRPAPSEALERFLATLDGRHVDATAAGTIVASGVVPLPSEPRVHTGVQRQATVSLPSFARPDARVEWSVTWEWPAGDRAQHARDLSDVRAHVTHVRRALARSRARHDRTARGWRSGRPDRAKLHALAFGHPYVFSRKEQEDGRGVAVVLLVDESGSMQGEKVATARRVAVLFHAALASQPDVDLFVYGHSADQPERATNLFGYWEPRRRGTGHGLGSIGARANNRDGVAIGAVAQEVVRLTHRPEIVMFVLSDGQPHAFRYAGRGALLHTRRVVRSLRSIRVVHVRIGAEAGEAIADDAFAFTSLSELPRQMGRLLERELARA